MLTTKFCALAKFQVAAQLRVQPSRWHTWIWLCAHPENVRGKLSAAEGTSHSYRVTEGSCSQLQGSLSGDGAQCSLASLHKGYLAIQLLQIRKGWGLLI